MSKTRTKKKQTSLKEFFGSLRHIPRFFKKVWSASPNLFILNCLARLIISVLPIAILWIGKEIIDEVIRIVESSQPNNDVLWQFVAIEFALVISSDLLSRFISLTTTLLGNLYANASSVELIRKTAQMNLQDLEDSEFYDRLERARQQTSNRITLLSDLLSQIQGLITIVSLIVGLIVFEPWLIVLLVVAIIPSFINELKFTNSSYSLAYRWSPERRELDYLRYIGASDVSAKEVKLFGLSDFIADRFSFLSDKYYIDTKDLAVRRSLWGALFNILGSIAYYGAYILIIFRVIAGIISIGELTFLAGSFNRLRNNLQQMFTRFTKITESSMYLKDYFEFMDLNIETKEDDKSIPLPKVIKTGFRFEEVSFSYPGSKTDVLSNLSFSITAGEKIAFVGQNGAGKTTLIKLMLRFYEPTTGRIYLDGIDIKNYNKSEYQQYFGVIFQDFLKYNFSARDNIAVGQIEKKENLELVKFAAEQSLAAQVITELPLAYDQQLGRRFKNGVDLSGGQWQKIALGRAYMKGAQVIILDEPTSALDARAEYETFQRFIGLIEGKTAVIISHRFSTVRMADRILVLKSGKILEIGSHKELMQNGNLYAELFNLQAVGYQ
ncbi:MAG: ATP-binding cassette subfamily B protein [Saprospiraceae bacterium]|jgi:ATP-binding cassette subfamily B protein